MSQYRASNRLTGPPLGPPRLISRPPTRKSSSDSLLQSSGPPNHTAFTAGSANALYTREGGASNVRSRVNDACAIEWLVIDSSPPGPTEARPADRAAAPTWSGAPQST